MNTKKRKKRSRKQNLAGMILITLMVCILVGVLVVLGRSLEKKIAQNKAKMEQLTQEEEKENQRTKDIEKLQKYMESDEYMEKIAKDKIGLVKDNEILFKENK